jgi:hypothetical protein
MNHITWMHLQVEAAWTTWLFLIWFYSIQLKTTNTWFNKRKKGASGENASKTN